MINGLPILKAGHLLNVIKVVVGINEYFEFLRRIVYEFRLFSLCIDSEIVVGFVDRFYCVSPDTLI